jgi:hypothetical protein
MFFQSAAHRDRHWEDAACDHRWDHLSYRVRIRATGGAVYLWGSAGIAQAIAFPTAPLFHVRNDELGEPVTIGTAIGANTTLIGTLQPGECVSIPVQNITGIYAAWPAAAGGPPVALPSAETTVSCFIKTS